MPNSVSYKVQDNLWLVNQPVPHKAPTVKVKPPTNHIVVIDCSGSMAGDLPRIREQLKRKVPLILQKEDTLSIIWFSGRSQFGVLFEAEPVSTLADLQQVNKAIDRWLQPIGMTGFREPLEEVSRLAKRIAAKRPTSVASLFFMSDGYDNQWNKADILKAVQNAGMEMAATTIVEYGYYADRALLTQMAERAGGALVFSQDFGSYAPSLEASLTKLLSGAPKVEIKLQAEPLEGVLFSLTGTDLFQYAAQSGSVMVSEDQAGVWYLSGSPVGAKLDLADTIPHSSQDTSAILQGAYGALATLALKAKPDLAYKLLKAIGDVQVIKEFAGCFGKQKYSEFRDHCIRLATGVDHPFQDGWDPSAVPDDNAFTVLGLLRALAADDDCQLLLDSEDFQYKRIGRAQVANQDLTDEEAQQIADLTAQLQGTKNAKQAKDLTAQIQAITDEAAKREPLKFKAKPAPHGYPVQDLVFNEDRANVSIRIRRQGTVTLPEGRPDKIPAEFETYQWRNYTIIKDGIVNVERLPVRAPKGVCKALLKAGMPEDCIQAPAGEDRKKVLTRFRKAADDRPVDMVLDLSRLPVVNRAMVQQVSAEYLFKLCWAALVAKASQKVYNTLQKEKFPRKSEGFEYLYGAEGAKWLQEQGITDFGGFSPATKQAPAVDQYIAKELEVKIKGFSTLPSLNDLAKKVASGKPLTGAAKLMAPFHKQASTVPAENLEASLAASLKIARKEARDLMFAIAQVKFSIIVGQVWFKEFASLEDNTMTLKLDGQDVQFTAEMREVTETI